MSFGGFGSNNSTFGSSGGFGSNTANSSPFGSNTGGSLFGGNNNTGSSFGGNNNTNTFGSTGGFGNTNSSFGGNNNTGSFGSSTFGAANNNSSFGGSNLNPAGANFNPNNDFEIPAQDCPQDAISCLEWSPTSNLLVVGSWDNSVRCFQVNGGGMQSISTQAKAYIQHQKPVLDVSFKSDGSGVFTGGCDNTVKWWQFNSNQGLQQGQDIGRHDAPVKCVHWIQESNILATAGWDRQLRFWDMRSPNPVASFQLPERAYCMDVKHPVMVIGTGGSDLDRNLLLYDLSRLGPNMTPTTVLSQSNAPLKKQYRCVSIFPDKSGYAIGSIEGRVAIWYIDPSQQSKNFAFKCHRDKDLKSIYSVNAISFHPKFHTLSTAGGDGKWNFWDKDSKQRLKATNAILCGQNRPLPITCSGFNNTGELFAYGVSYDWSMGAENNPKCKNYVLIHNATESETKPRRSLNSSRRR
mmetsp:Transcript_3502/g.3904  ORF Transcript_3502/g.3904 Transcript_3502/m.3904 type:complete len:465 (-) Transcript_3502:449-1843(-)